jgi:hypothetical protein
MSLGFALYFLIAVTSAIAVFLGTDESAKYIEPDILFWARGINGIIAGTALTMKGYTSEGFANWKKKKSETQMWKKDTGP